MNAPSTAHPMNATQERALALLGDGFPPSVVAASVGVSESYISQLMSLEWFASQVQEIKFLNLKKHTELDNKYDDLEYDLVEKLQRVSKLLVKPKDISDVLRVVNGAKRRGAGASQDQTIVQQNVINLTIPAALVHRFTSNANNQVVEVQDGSGQSRTLVTAPSGSLERLAREARETEELSTSLRGTLLEGIEGSSGENNAQGGSEETISTEALLKLAGSAAQKALVKGLNESERTSGKIKAEDL